jgi:hypothetical protein
MNERIRELIKEASLDDIDRISAVFDVEKFAQSLIEDVLTCIDEELEYQHRVARVDAMSDDEDHSFRTWAKIDCLDEVLYTIRRRYVREE